MQQHSSTAHQTSRQPQQPTPQQKWGLPINLQNLQSLICRQMSKNLRTHFQEHIRYIKTNNPQLAYAQHILHNQHEYGTLTKSMIQLKPLQHESMLLPVEQLHIQSLHHAGHLIPEQYPNDLNPLFHLAFSHPPPTHHRAEPVKQHPANKTHNPQLYNRPAT